VVQHLNSLPLTFADKRPGDQLFDTFDANDLNKRLRELMDGLSAKVGF
jgi:DNA topoisomerase-1